MHTFASTLGESPRSTADVTVKSMCASSLIQIHEVGTHDGQVFLAMELIEGRSLRRWLDAEPRSWREVVEVFRAAGEGLATAHVAGLIHRDFKPDNVLVESGRVFVGDFGLARGQLGDGPHDSDSAHAPVDLRVTCLRGRASYRRELGRRSNHLRRDTLAR